jgi:hypothetical protein
MQLSKFCEVRKMSTRSNRKNATMEQVLNYKCCMKQHQSFAQIEHETTAHMLLRMVASDLNFSHSIYMFVKDEHLTHAVIAPYHFHGII